MKHGYLVQYSTGDYHEFEQKEIFVATNESKALKYCERFNRILKDLCDLYMDKKRHSRLKANGCKMWDRQKLNELQKINECYYSKIEIR